MTEQIILLLSIYSTTSPGSMDASFSNPSVRSQSEGKTAHEIIPLYLFTWHCICLVTGHLKHKKHPKQIPCLSPICPVNTYDDPVDNRSIIPTPWMPFRSPPRPMGLKAPLKTDRYGCFLNAPPSRETPGQQSGRRCHPPPAPGR